MDRKKIDNLIKKLKRLKKDTVFKRKIDIGNDDDCGGEN